MHSLINKLVVGAATLAIASAPLVASAQDWHHDGGPREHVVVHERIVNRNVHYGYGRPVYHRWHEGYYGVAPAGFHGYYHNGAWYHHRRQQAGIFIYF
jgi:hypothetical protein